MTGINDVNAVPEEVSELDKEDKELTKEEHAVNFAKILAEIDRSITPFREHKRDLKESYKTNNWLSKEEMTDIAKAYRSMKGDQDINKIADYVKLFKDNNL